MKKIYLVILCFYTYVSTLHAQLCGTCAIDYAYLAAGVHPDTLPDATAGDYYEFDLTFVLLADTTVDILGTPTTLDFLNYNLMEPVGMPYGMHASSNLGDFPVNYDPDLGLYGCAKVCGTPLIAGFYEITVPIIATLESPGGEQPASYSLYITVLPADPTSGGIVATPTFGCDPLSVDFETGVPSGGAEGISYAWDFGDGTFSTLENPGLHNYYAAGDEPMSYIVTETVTVDTVGFQLDYVTVTETNCNDCAIFGCTGAIEGEKPDIYIQIDALGINTFPGILDTYPPLSFTFNAPMAEGTTYYMSVKDDDAGGFGSDDNCGNLMFDTGDLGLHSYELPGGSNIDMSISHPVFTTTYIDTIIVYPYPAIPELSVIGDTAFCVGDSVILSATGDPDYFYQWYKDSVGIPEAHAMNYTVYSSGNYSVSVTTPGGCSATSAIESIDVYAYPYPPAIVVFANTLNTSSDFDLQWYYSGSPIPGATGEVYTPGIEGTYSVAATNGPCTSFSGEINFLFQSVIDYDLLNLAIYPNPSSGIYTLEFTTTAFQAVHLDVINILGEKIIEKNMENICGNFNYQLNMSKFANGIYFLTISSDQSKTIQKIIKQ